MRSFENRILENLDKIKCPVHLSLGQENISVEIERYIHKSDWLYSTHRNHGHYLAKGGSEERLWDEICGLESGINMGLFGSQCFSDPSINFHSSSIVGGSIGIAVGTAFGIKDSRDIVVCCLGDGATEQGIFWESLNFSVLYNLRILFICENNGLSINVPISERQAGSISRKVSAFGIQVCEYIEQGFECSRKGKPAFIEVKTIREGDHCYFPKQ